MSNRSRTILCGVDGSDQSVRAAPVAHALSTALPAGLVLAHVSPGGIRPLPVPHPMGAASDEELERDLRIIEDTARRAGLAGARKGERTFRASRRTAGQRRR